ncbi:MAG TPA: hypothetical protein VJI69_01195 [Bacteroidia bacterium]|nr:hypothetical protein [Bacteroidia bacterium]
MKINTNYLIIGVLVLLLVLSSVQAVKISNIKNLGTNVGALDTTGWTEDEIMNYEMHGTIPSRIGGGASTGSGSGMVGGC